MKNQIEKTKIDLWEVVKKWWIFAKIKDKFFLVPKNVRLISLSVFVFMLGRWIGWDTFYSIFIESIVENVFRVSLIWAVLPLVKLFVAPAVWELNDDSDKKHVYAFSKILYIISSIFYVAAWFLKNPRLLLIAVIINWVWSSSTFVTYFSSVRENCNKNHSEASWWLFFTWYNGAYVVWALISALLIQFVNLPFLYVFIAVFSFLSLLIDWKIPFHEWNNKMVSENHFDFVKKFWKRCFSIQPMKKMIVSLKSSSRSLWNGLWYEMLYALLDYLSLLFIPLVALSDWLWLWQIAIVFAVMRLPYIFNLFVSWRDEWFNKKLFIAVVLVFLAWLFVILWFNLSFWMILVVSFCISFWLSVMKPVVSAMITEHAQKDNIWLISWAEQFATFLWNVMWSIWFWVLSSIFTMNIAFFIVWLSLAVLAWLSFFKRWKEKVKKMKKQ